jgi:hypothetical protein
MPEPEAALTGRAAPRRCAASMGKKLALLAAALLLALTAAELVVRRLSPQTLGFEFTASAFRNPTEFVRDMARNSRGNHDREHGLPGPAPRVLLLGDSYVAGLSVPVSQTVGARLEAHSPAGTNWEVVALSREGWGQSEQLKALEFAGRAVRPAVVLTLFMPFNDVRNNWPPLQATGLGQLERMSRFRPGWTKLSAADAPALLMPWSALNRLLSHRLAMARARRPDGEIPIDYLVYAAEPDAQWQEAWAATESLLLKTRDVAAALGAKYLVASASTPHGVLGPEDGLQFIFRSYPAMNGRKWDLDLPDRRLAAFCGEHGIPFLALEPHFRDQTRAGERLHWTYDGHWNSAGNDLAARLLAQFIFQNR